MPTPVTLRPARATWAMTLSGFGLGLAFMVTNTVGELIWIVGLVLVVFYGLALLDLRQRRVVVTADTLVRHRSFRTRTYPLREVTLHEGKRGITIRHKGDRILLHMPREQAILKLKYEPSLSWKVALETMEGALESARRQDERGA